MTAVYSSTARTNALLVRTVYDLFNENKLEQALTYATKDVNLIIYALGQEFNGRAGFLAFMQNFKQAFPDLKIEVVNQVADDDQVVCEITAIGLHLGKLVTPAGPIPPTGLKVHFTACEVWKFRDGKFYSLHNYQDAAGILRQLGQM